MTQIKGLEGDIAKLRSALERKNSSRKSFNQNSKRFRELKLLYLKFPSKNFEAPYMKIDG